jgi:hypothetical protein
MSVVRRFAAAGLEAAARRGRRGGMVIGAIDETEQEKAGEATAGVKRQYLGCAGKVANGINTVHLSYVREGAGHALIGARQWVPREHIEDPVKSLVMGLPLDLAFRTNGQLAIDISTDAAADGIRLDPPPPSPLTMVPQTRQARPGRRDRPAQLAKCGCLTSAGGALLVSVTMPVCPPELAVYFLQSEKSRLTFVIVAAASFP